jgi:hypothetical protein
MAINWILALKAVPWADVVQAAPHIVKGARRLFNSARQSEAVPVEPSQWAGGGRDADSVHARLDRLETGLQTVDREQQDSAELIRSLAEQNARIVEAIQVLRARVRLLLGLTLGLTLGGVVALVWVAT